MTTLRQAAKAGYGVRILAVKETVKACGTKFRDLYKLERPTDPQKWAAPAGLARYGLLEWARTQEE